MIIADGKYGTFFVKKILEDKTSKNTYHIATSDANIKDIYKDILSVERVIFFHIATSPVFLKKIIKKHIYQHIAVCLKTKTDTMETLINLKDIDIKSKISFLNQWSDCVIKDESITSINAFDILPNRLLNTVPNIINTAENIGMGAGEIIEVDVPRESSYIYKRLSAIKQKNFSVVGIYRGKEFILPTASSMIHPNDKLLVVGTPYVLQNFYNSVNNKTSLTSFSKELLLIIDMQKNSSSQIFKLIKKAIRLYRLLKLKKILITIIHPTNIQLLDRLKNLHKKYIFVKVDYSEKGILLTEIKKLSPSFIIVSSNVFEKYKKILYRSRFPVLSTNNAFLPVDNFVLFETKNYIPYESISSLAFDFTSKMNITLTMSIATIKKDETRSIKQKKQDELIEHYQIIASISKVKTKTKRQALNPIKSLQSSYSNPLSQAMQTIPFGRDIVYSNKMMSIFMKNSDLLYYKLSSYDQLFLPL